MILLKPVFYKLPKIVRSFVDVRAEVLKILLFLMSDIGLHDDDDRCLRRSERHVDSQRERKGTERDRARERRAGGKGREKHWLFQGPYRPCCPLTFTLGLSGFGPTLCTLTDLPLNREYRLQMSMG